MAAMIKRMLCTILIFILITNFSVVTFSNEGKYAMSYIYFGTASDRVDVSLLSSHALDVVSPCFFEIDANGNLKTLINTSYIEQMHDAKLKVVPFLSNHWNRTAGQIALRDPVGLAMQIIPYIEKYNLDGINVDIENVTHTERDAMTEFVKTLRENIPKEKEVSVAVAANPKNWQLGWHGSYDYEQLGKYSDHLFLMTYDEHYSGGVAGPVASIQFVEESILYALQYVAPEKIVVGLPFFGRVWDTAGDVKGKSVTWSALDAYLKQNPDIPQYYDEHTKSVYVEVYNNGKKYIIWIENLRSIKEKLLLVDKYDLKGAGNWSGGNEPAELWDYYEFWLNGSYYEDIDGHFAEDEILSLSKDEIIFGVTETTFEPDSVITREQIAAIITRVLRLDGVPENSSFTDIDGIWSYDDIMLCHKEGIISGYEDNSFKPKKTISYEEIVSIIANMMNLPKKEATGMFLDVDVNSWSASYIETLVTLGIIEVDSEYFYPKRLVTRGDACLIIYNAIEAMKAG